MELSNRLNNNPLIEARTLFI